MPRLRPDLRLSWVALAAIVGLLPLAGEASASAAGNASSCCAKHACPMMCCQKPCTPSGHEAARPLVAVALVRGGLVSLPAVPCECRSDDPAESAPKPETPTSNHRSEQDNRSIDLSIDSSRPAVSVAHRTPAFGLSRAPLLLNTTRLLI